MRFMLLFPRLLLQELARTVDIQNEKRTRFDGGKGLSEKDGI
jgi:hypothetical protein